MNNHNVDIGYTVYSIYYLQDVSSYVKKNNNNSML